MILSLKASIIVRQKLVQSRGREFGRPFKISNLWGLARLALPKEYTLVPFEEIKKESSNTVVKVEPASVSILHYERTMRLAKAAVVHLPGLVPWAEENRNSTGYGMDSKLGKFNREYAAFEN